MKWTANGDFAHWPRPVREYAFGFVYWLGFLVVLEPDNVLRALRAGQTVSVGHEAGRILVAALLGAVATPPVMALTRRFPVRSGRLRHLSIHCVSASGMALGLILVSCFLAAWLYEGVWLPTMRELSNQLIGNWMLLSAVLLALAAIGHAMQFFVNKEADAAAAAAGAAEAEQETAGAYLKEVAVKTRGQLRHVSLDSVDWIETQGNYLALHTDAGTHLVRETLTRFETRLDPRHFARVHRRVIVAVDRIRAIAPLGNGDAILTLEGDRELRASRTHGDAIRQRWLALRQRT